MGTWIIGGLVFAALTLAARKTWKDHKNGGCDGACAHCRGCAYPPDPERPEEETPGPR